MNHTTKRSGKMLLKDQIGSPSTDEGSSGGSIIGGGGSSLKKGPWTSAEDAILVEYVKKHGEGNWNAVQKHSGLSRCGKSCRLRWANHLRPNLKKGAFTEVEENTIIELHSQLGNKWARMATNLPGRTDNEIKNYWNTRIKRRQRAGLPVYPPNISISSSDENHQDQNFGELSSGDKMQNEVLHGNGYDIPDFSFNGYNASYVPSFSEIPVNNMLNQGFGSQNYGIISQSLHHKRPRLHETLYPVYPASIGNWPPLFENFSNDPSKYTQPALGETSYPYDPDPYGSSIPGSHGLIMNGNNLCTSRSLLGAVKSELPSLQYTETESPSSWFETDAVDAYIQSPPALSTQSECSSPWNSGLLEEVLHESQALRTGKKQVPDKSSNSSAMTPSDLMDCASNNFYYDETAWEEDSDPISPLGCSAASVCNKITPPINGSSGSDIMLPNTAGHSTPNMWEVDVKPKLPRPDALLGSSWLFQSSQTKDQTELSNAIAALLGDDCCSEHKPVIAETSSSFTSGLGRHSLQWNNMPHVCQMPEIP